MKTVIEVEAYGDFDMRYTECIMIHSENIDKTKLMKEFYELQNITSNSGLSYEILDTITADFIAFLELKGFTKLETHSVCFSD